MKHTSFVLLLALLAGCTTVKSLSVNDREKLKEQQSQMLKEHLQLPEITFHAQHSATFQFPSFQLTSDYTLKVKADSVIADLPYFGRVFVAPIDPTQSGYRFVSTRFERTIKPGKRAGYWVVTVKTLDTPNRLFFRLDAWETGMASLSVTDPDRQAIRYDGTVE